MFTGFEYFIVGAGLFGSVVAERLAGYGKKVCVLEKRNHIGGNCYDEFDPETDILTHKYGPHIFHADDDEVLKYIHGFTDFNRYFHQVLSVYKDKIYQLPFNLETINAFYGINLKPFEVRNFLDKEIAKENIQAPANMEEKAVSLIGRPLYEAFIKEYTAKQWGKEPKDLPESIIKRIPVRNNYYECYYNKKFHGMPVAGYAKMFEKMLSSPNIKVRLNTDYFTVRNQLPENTRIVFTGPIDKFFDCKYGKLEYRKVTFQREIHPVQDWQGTSVVNYPELKHEFTRICEPRHFYMENWGRYAPDRTVIFKEFSSFDDGEDPYYPINDLRNASLRERYEAEAEKRKNVIFGGRLGEYKYYDMEDSIRAALELVKTIIARVEA